MGALNGTLASVPSPPFEHWALLGSLSHAEALPSLREPIPLLRGGVCVEVWKLPVDSSMSSMGEKMALPEATHPADG